MKLVKVVVVVLLVVMSLSAEMPVGNLGLKAVGISYTFEMNGFTLEDGEGSASMTHLGGLHFAPIPYAMFILKFGGAKSFLDNGVMKDMGTPGFAFRGGISLFTPEFANIFTVTGGSNFSTWESDLKDGYVLTRNVRSHLGVIIEALAFVDLELGAKHTYWFGKTSNPGFDGLVYTNPDEIMGYVQVTLHEPKSGAFLQLGGDFSPEFDTGEDGIYNGVLSVSIGTVLRHQKRSKFSRE